jgi:hypothetical protein
MSAANVDAIAMTADGCSPAPSRRLSGPRYAGFGDQPPAFARDIRRALTVEGSRRSRAARARWRSRIDRRFCSRLITRFLHLGDVAILKKLVSSGGTDVAGAGASTVLPAAGAVTTLAEVAIIVAEAGYGRSAGSLPRRRRLVGVRLPARLDVPFEPAFYAASVGEWQGFRD